MNRYIKRGLNKNLHCLSFSGENGTAEIIRLADWDTIKTNWFANEAIRYILSLSPDALKKYMLVPLEPPLIS